MGTRVWLDQPMRLAGVLLPASAAAVGVVTLRVVPRSDLAVTTHAGASWAAGVADLAAGLGLLGAGLLVWLFRPGSGSGPLVVSMAGLAWLAADWVGWEGGPPVARSLAMAVEPFFLAFVVHLVLAAPGGRLRSRRRRIAVGAVYAVAAIVSVGRALVSAQPDVARALDSAWILLSLAVGLLLAALMIRLMAAATPTARRSMWPILAPGLLLGMAVGVHALALLRQRLESPRDLVFSSLFQVRAWAAAGLAVGIVLVAVRAWRARATLARLAADLGEAPAPGSLGLALASATGDPSIGVLYLLPGSERHVDASGTTVDPPATGSRRAVTRPVCPAGCSRQ